jgi:ABC-type branched-subunit amino acid transport system ATPase component
LASTQRAYVLERGAIVQQGASSELQNDPAIIEHYLGSGQG